MQARQPHSEKASKGAGRGWFLALVIFAALGVVGGWFWLREPTLREGTELSGLSPLATASDREVYANYAGSKSCQYCHQVEFDLWKNSHHGLAEREIQPDMDNAAFNPARSFKHGTQTSQAIAVNGDFKIVTLGFQTNIQPYRVERVIGHDPVRQFLTAAPGGRWQVHEASYDPRLNQWFDVYGDEDRKPGEWGHWTGGGMNWNSRCAECHNTRLRKHYDETTDTYHTTMAEMSVGCEACHGPLKKHVEWRRAHVFSKSKEPAFARLTPVQEMDTCGSCHARQDNLTGNFQPGDSFYDHYSLSILDSAERWYPDGQVKDEDYEFTSFLSSRMHQSGVTCQDCHNPHSMKARLPGNNLCLRCHNGSFPKAPVITAAEHTHHKSGGKGDECVGCHMPVTVYMQRQARHDHGMTIPDPLLSKQLGIPNACNRCHADKSDFWSLTYTEQWYGGKMNRHTRERAQWIAAAQKGEDSAKQYLLVMVTGTNESPYWRAVAGSLLWRWVNDPNAKAALVTALNNDFPPVREAAVRSLAEVEHPENIPALNQTLNDSARSVRVAGAWTLRATVDMQSRAGRELRSALDLDADQPTGQFHKAMLLFSRQQTEAALEHLQKAVVQDPFSPPLRYELGEVLAQMGRVAEGLETLSKAESLSPDDPQIPYACANILLKNGRYTEARAALNRALKVQPNFEPALELLQHLPSDNH